MECFLTFLSFFFKNKFNKTNKNGTIHHLFRTMGKTFMESDF